MIARWYDSPFISNMKNKIIAKNINLLNTIDLDVLMIILDKYINNEYTRSKSIIPP